MAIDFPDWSVNRSKYSEPEDVLIPDYQDWGIAMFKVADVPPSVESPGGIQFEFRVAHVPFEDNYAHSEVRTYKDGKHDRSLGNKINKTVKKTFRQILSDRMIVIHQPNV